ncbi:UNVERIFIED_CONTAM: hypothetical protein Sradi_3583700 [Sesamum radiatum]|uniref:Uncharacterized protein n=1 Tax=Sesamum radiatum TaxID=300843 RepID=A0AAW2QGD0_SESRA
MVNSSKAKRYKNGVRDCISNKGLSRHHSPKPMGSLRGSTRKSPFTLVYETETIIPTELGMLSHRVLHFSEEDNTKLLKEHLDLVEELREKVFIRTQRYKNTMINTHNRRVKARYFQIWDPILRRVDNLKPVGKLDPN